MGDDREVLIEMPQVAFPGGDFAEWLACWRSKGYELVPLGYSGFDPNGVHGPIYEARPAQ